MLSSAQTFWMKVVFPVLWIGGFAVGTIAMFLAGDGLHDNAGHLPPSWVKWIFLLVTLAGSPFIYWCCGRLKRISIDGSSLVISNYLKEIVAPCGSSKV